METKTKNGAFIKRLAQAQELTDRYRKKYPNKKYGQLFSEDLIRAILDYDQCDNLLVLYGLTPDDELTLVLAPADIEGKRVGMVVDPNGKVQRPEAAMKDGLEDQVLDNGNHVPPPFN